MGRVLFCVMIAASNCKFAYVEDTVTAEALALQDGLNLTQLAGCNWLVVISNCMEVIDTMIRGRFNLTPAAAIYGDFFWLLLILLRWCLSIVLGKLRRLLMF
ncbi:hypothetical protein BRADI_3g51255v3 [Brachypodium distachyon]|uniref:RNase H type-1 domain-containing protein n=1 Tax=Brachypodium distachyon TaxID=15368 RepID=A0A2K2D4J7_BRADI|nr:hypothetical protein BRADI_3g51255v3 [Brachypodium distachyon]